MLIQSFLYKCQILVIYSTEKTFYFTPVFSIVWDAVILRQILSKLSEWELAIMAKKALEAT
jgi:hypothetical protein